MSVQLILYPQRPIPGNANEFVVNGINFSNPPLSSASTYSSSVATAGTPTALIQNVLTNASPTIPNLWYRFISTASATPSAPTNVSNNAVFNSVGATSGSGIYQEMTNLIPGELYNFSVDFSNTTFAGSISCAVYNGTTLLAANGQVTNGIGISFGNFWTQPAGSTTATIVLTYSSAFSQNFTIQKVSVQSLQLVSNITNSIQDGQVILDLYEDENIPLTLSVDEFKNVAEQVQSYSKAFNLPATKRNNQIFENLFEVTRSAQNSITFNPYVRSRSVLKQDGFILFEGYLRVLDIQDKEGEISYNVNLYSEVVSFADTLKDKTFNDLNFTELEHDYNITNVLYSWADSGTGITYTNSSTSGFRNAFTTVKYPFVDWNHSYTVDATTGYPNLPNLESSFRPFINIKYLIDRIFQATEFTYESAFFNEVDFNKLYMDFNWGADNSPVTIDNTDTAKTATQYTATGSFSTMAQDDNAFNSDFGYSSGVYTAQHTNQTYNIDYKFNTVLQSVNLAAYILDTRWEMVKGGNTTYIDIANITGVGDGSPSIVVYSSNFTEILDTGDTLTPQWRLQTVGPAGTSWIQAVGATTVVSISMQSATTETILQTLRGELGQWEFLKGIMTMFNLIASPDKSNPNNIIIEPYKDMFLPSITGTPNFFDNNSTQLDWTDKIDITEIKLEVLTDLNKRTVFKFVEDDDDAAFNVYKTAVQGHLYGSQVFDASTTTGNLQSVLEGEEEIIAEPFAATVPKPLMSQFF
jgi:hypothetical protein